MSYKFYGLKELCKMAGLWTGHHFLREALGFTCWDADFNLKALASATAFLPYTLEDVDVTCKPPWYQCHWTDYSLHSSSVFSILLPYWHCMQLTQLTSSCRIHFDNCLSGAKEVLWKGLCVFWLKGVRNCVFFSSNLEDLLPSSLSRDFVINSDRNHTHVVLS